MSLSNLGSFDIFAAHPSMSIHKVRIPCTCCSKKKGKGKEKAKAKGKGSSLLIQLHLRNPPRNPINSLYLYLISHNLCTLPQLLQEAVNVVSQLCHKAACTKWGSWSGGGSILRRKGRMDSKDTVQSLPASGIMAYK